MIAEDPLENILKNQLQKHLAFDLNNKVYKKGHLSLYRMETYNNNFEISFIFEKPEEDKIETFKVPYPFAYEAYGDIYGGKEAVVFFDYRLYTLTNNNKLLERYLKEISKKDDYPKSKYFDKILKIHCNLSK